MEERQRLEIGERIASLRERSPYTQPALAEKLGIGLRGYQKLEKEGTTRYERCQEIAAIHAEWAASDPDWSFVSAGWLWDGKERATKADLMDSLKEAEGNPSIQRLEDQLAALRTELLSELAQVRLDLEDLRQKRARPARKAAAKRK
jgi:transcriptional regulator with XRE-family HTH domain